MTLALWQNKRFTHPPLAKLPLRAIQNILWLNTTKFNTASHSDFSRLSSKKPNLIPWLAVFLWSARHMFDLREEKIEAGLLLLGQNSNIVCMSMATIVGVHFLKVALEMGTFFSYYIKTYTWAFVHHIWTLNIFLFRDYQIVWVQSVPL